MTAMKMIEFFRPVLVATVLILAASCTKEDIIGQDNPVDGKEVMVNFSYSVNAMVSGDGAEQVDYAPTRVIPNTITDGTGIPIKNMWIIQFNGTDPTSTMLGAPRFVSESDMTASPLLIPLIETSGNAYTLFVANMAGGATYSWNMSEASTFAEVVKQVKTFTVESGSYEIFSDGVQTLLMSAVTTGQVQTSGSLSPVFTRNVAKVTLNLSVDVGSGTVIKSVRLRNVPIHISYADAIATTLGLPDNNIAVMDYDPITATADLPAVGGSQGYTWYVPRNGRGTSALTAGDYFKKTSHAPNYATYFEIVAVKGTTTSIFRVYPGANNYNDYNILPNKHYTTALNVTDIGTDPADSRVERFDNVVEFFTGEGRTSNSFILNPMPLGGGDRKFRIPIDQVNRYWGKGSGTNEAGYGNNPSNVIAAGDVWEIRWLWTDYDAPLRDGITISKSGGIGPEEYFEITVPEVTRAGNAVVSLRKTGGMGSEVLWSWHFWVTEYNPNAFNNTFITDGTYTYAVPGGQVERYANHTGSRPNIWQEQNAGRVMMDRSLGITDKFTTLSNTTRGILHYQFGRKDPFPLNITLTDHGIFTTQAETLGPVPIAKGVENPNVFYRGQGTQYNWATEANELTYEWNDPQQPSSGLKSIYDPCPPGWRLPLDGTWNDFNRQDAGGAPITVRNELRDLAYDRGQAIGTVNGLRYWPGTTRTDPVGGRIWYPATGLRDWSSGTLSYVGSYGYYWSATPGSATHGRYLGFSATGVYPNHTGNRAGGFAARCLSE